MINYSIVLRRTDINDENSPKRAYPTAQCTEVMELDKFCKHIADHGCAYDRADVSAIATKIVDCLREQLLAGNKVKLGELGAFSVSLSSKGAENAEKFTSAMITEVKVNWEPGKEFTDLLKDATFQQVPTRVAAAATLKAEKAGESTVDIEAAKNAKKKPSADPSDPSTDPGNGGGGGGNEPAVTKYKVTFMHNGSVHTEQEYAEGETIEKPEAPSGYIWVSCPDTMPARDITVTSTDPNAGSGNGL